MTDAAISDTIEALAGALDRLASRVCDADPAERTAVLCRLRHMHDDLDALVVDVERNIHRAKSAESH